MARLYSNLKFLRFRDRLEALETRRLAAPVHVRIKPINRCNHNCWYCAYRVDNLQLGDGMELTDRIPDAKMFEIVEDVVAMGVKAVTFSGGGEPLLYKPLPEVVDALAAGGVRIGCLSNGSNLRGRMAEAFARHATWLRVSIDSWDDASHTRHRGTPDGSFTQLVDNMRAFAASGTACVLGVSLIIGAENKDRIFEVCALMRDIGVDHVKLSGVVVANSGAENNAYHARIKDEVAAQIARAKTLSRDGFAVIDHYHDLDELFDKDYRSCPFLQFLTVIGADCKVYACQDKAYTEAGLLGSIAQTRFRDFWFSEENHRRLFGIDPSRDCRHHCVAHAKNLVLHEILSTEPAHGVFV
ncbi:MAG: radical SAM protein [Alphaproteobacteria bacterium]|nr:radical SAM protein [Alphaproteobacteria bacterium]